MQLNLDFTPSVSGGFVAWGNFDESFLAVQGDDFPPLETEIREGIKLIDKHSARPQYIPVFISMRRKYIRPTVLQEPLTLPGAFGQFLRSRKDGTESNDSHFLYMANWSEGRILLPKTNLKPELVTVIIPVLEKWIKDAQQGSGMVPGSVESAIRTCMQRAAENR